MLSGQAWQPLRRQSRNAFAARRRRQRQQTPHRRVAAVDVNLEFSLRGARVTDPNLGCIRPDFIIERQGRDGGNDAGPFRQVNPVNINSFSFVLFIGLKYK